MYDFEALPLSMKIHWNFTFAPILSISVYFTEHMSMFLRGKVKGERGEVMNKFKEKWNLPTLLSRLCRQTTLDHYLSSNNADCIGQPDRRAAPSTRSWTCARNIIPTLGHAVNDCIVAHFLIWILARYSWRGLCWPSLMLVYINYVLIDGKMQRMSSF